MDPIQKSILEKAKREPILHYLLEEVMQEGASDKEARVALWLLLDHGRVEFTNRGTIRPGSPDGRTRSQTYAGSVESTPASETTIRNSVPFADFKMTP